MTDNVVINAHLRPIELAPNQVDHFYRGGEAISRLRGTTATGDRRPEDWLGATVSRFGTADVGLTRLADGTTLRSAIEADPEGYLGPEHVAQFGADTELLVKLIDAGERLPVHCHPDRDFSRRHLDCPHGKTEGWVIVETRESPASVFLGFTKDVDPARLADWVARQDTDAICDSMNRLTVQPGDSVLVPAGLPHAIGEGILLVELQEPSDLSVLLEWKGFALDGRRDGHLGLGFEVALGCVDRSGWGAATVDDLRTAAPEDRASRRLFPHAADPFFRADWLAMDSGCTIDAGFSILVVLEGSGELVGSGDSRLAVQRGTTVLVPWGAGSCHLTGRLEAVLCRPPAPAASTG